MVSTHAKGRTAPAEKSYVPMIDMPEVKVPIGKGEPSGITNVRKVLIARLHCFTTNTLSMMWPRCV